MSNSASRPNIFLIILDAVRAESLSCYGYPREISKHLSSFVSESVLFRNAFTTSTWTIPTHASLLSGLYLSQHRIESVKADRCFNHEIITIPEILRSHGYRTAAFSQNILFSPEHHLTEGFDEYNNTDILLNSHILGRMLSDVSGRSKSLTHKFKRYLRKVTAPKIIFDSIASWVEKQTPNSPLFMMANLTSAHYGWAPPPGILIRQAGMKLKYLLDDDFLTLKPFDFNSGKRKVTAEHRQAWRHFYDASIQHLDLEIGRFMRRVRRWRGWDDTIIIITSDHGELLGDYRDIVGHTLSLSDKIIHIPLIIKHPQYPPNLKVYGVVQLLDLFPSILEWAGVSYHEVHPAQVQRPSLSKKINQSHHSGGIAFAEEDYTDSYDLIEGLLSMNPQMKPGKYPRRQIAVRSVSHKYIWYDDRPGEFYKVSSDPGEEKNLINSHIDQPILEKLEEALLRFSTNLERLPPQRIKGPEETDPELTERLRSLGYLA